MKKSEAERELPCPVCGNTMQVEKVHRASVDVCEEHGIWLDTGELEAIMRRGRLKGWRSRNEAVRKARRQGRVQGWLFGGLSFLFYD